VFDLTSHIEANVIGLEISV
jgi:hypothetical protein